MRKDGRAGGTDTRNSSLARVRKLRTGGGGDRALLRPSSRKLRALFPRGRASETDGEAAVRAPEARAGRASLEGRGPEVGEPAGGPHSCKPAF